MTTRRALIIKKYTALETELKQYFSAELFPSLEEGTAEVSDLVFLLTMTFVGVNDDDQYKEKIASLVTSNKIIITDDVFDIVCPLIAEFVKWLKAL